MSEKLTADVDAWAEAHGAARSDAIRQLIELGLSAAPSAALLGSIMRDPVENRGFGSQANRPVARSIPAS
jgi:hypothetical protein